MNRFIRIVSMTMALVMTLCALSVPSYANELEWINVLDYAMPNDGNSTQFSLPAGTTTVYFTLPVAINVNLIDMLVRTTSSDLKAQFGTRILTSVTVDTSYAKRVRIYGFAGGSQYQRIPITFTTSSACTVFIDKFYISPLWWADFADVGSVTLNVGSTTYTYTQPSKSDDVSFEFVPASSGLSPFNLVFSCANWAMYDYLRFDFYITCMEITSITGLFGTKAIDCKVSQIYDGTSDFDAWYVEVTLDLSNINHAVTAYVPEVFVVGTARGGTNCSCIFGKTVGFIESDIDLDNHFFRQWFTNIYDRLGTVDSSLGDINTSLGDIDTYIRTIPTAIASLFSMYLADLPDWISAVSTSVSTNFTTWFGKLETWISDQTTAISNKFTSLSGWITDQTDAIVGELVSLKDALTGLLEPEADTSQADSIVDQSQQIQDFESSHQEVLAGGLDTIQGGAEISRPHFIGALSLVATVASATFQQLGFMQIIYTLPLTIGFILFLASRAPGAFRPSHRSGNKSRSGSGHNSGSGYSDPVDYGSNLG